MFVYERINLESSTKLKQLDAPLHLFIKVTGKCMAKCSFCSQGGSHQAQMTNSYLHKVLDICVDFGIPSVSYTGGEPLLYPHILESLKYGKELRLQQSLITNGILLGELCKKAHGLEYVDVIGVSILGDEETHNKILGVSGAYINTVKALKQYGHFFKKIVINYTLNHLNNNYKCLYSVATLCKENNWKLCVNRLQPIGLAKANELDMNNQQIVDLINQIEKDTNEDMDIGNVITPCTINKKSIYKLKNCGAGITFLSIEADGDIKLCPSAEWSLGRLNNYEDLFSVWNSIILDKYRSLSWLPITCKSCGSLNSCMGGCKVEVSTKDSWPSFADASAINKLNLFYNSAKHSIIQLAFSRLRPTENGYIMLGKNIRYCNENVIELLKKINGRSMDDIVNNLSSNQKKEVIDLLFALHRDEFIKIGEI